MSGEDDRAFLINVYDDYGRITSTSDPLENETVYVYEDTTKNQPSVAENPDGSRYQYRSYTR